MRNVLTQLCSGKANAERLPVIGLAKLSPEIEGSGVGLAISHIPGAMLNSEGVDVYDF